MYRDIDFWSLVLLVCVHPIRSVIQSFTLTCEQLCATPMYVKSSPFIRAAFQDSLHPSIAPSEGSSASGSLLLTDAASICDKGGKKHIYNKLSYGTMIEENGKRLAGQTNDRETSLQTDGFSFQHNRVSEEHEMHIRTMSQRETGGGHWRRGGTRGGNQRVSRMIMVQIWTQ